MYKMVFTDLDGTIVSSDGISKSTIQTIEDLRKKDILFTFATGRHFSSVKGVLKELNIKTPYICGNGAYVYDPVKKKVVSETLLSEDTAKEVLERSTEYGLDFLVYTNKEMFGTERATEIIKNRLKDHFEITALTEEELNVLPVDNILKFLIIEDNEELILRLKDEFSMFKGATVVQSRSNYLDIGSSKASKGEAILRVCEYLGVSPDECIAFGDQENDVSMFKTVKTGVAMGNSDSVIKEVADVVTDSVSNDGFSKYISKSFKGL